MLDDPQVRRGILRTLRNPDHPAYAPTLKLVASYAYGVPAQRVEVTGVALIAHRIEMMTDAELQHAVTAPDEELLRLLPGEEEGDGGERE
jgi:hypothetical protein